MGIKKISNTSAFTLIEVIIVVAIIALILPGAVSLFFANLRSHVQVLLLQEVKRNGDFILNTLEDKMRDDAWALYSDAGATIEVCTTRKTLTSPISYSGTLYAREKDGTIFYFVDNSGVIEYTRNAATNALSNDKVAVTGFSVSCSRTSTFNPPTITVSFTVSQTGSSIRAEEKASLSYNARIKLRSY
ncbi:MAG: prepilin-type N-terminal cleavage/methylation domain-containing protein [Candidatus Paceibacterota bacterium]